MRLRKLFAPTHRKKMFAVLVVLTAGVGLTGAITYEPPLRAERDGSGASTTSSDTEDPATRATETRWSARPRLRSTPTTSE